MRPRLWCALRSVAHNAPTLGGLSCTPAHAVQIGVASMTMLYNWKRRPAPEGTPALWGGRLALAQIDPSRRIPRACTPRDLLAANDHVLRPVQPRLRLRTQSSDKPRRDDIM